MAKKSSLGFRRTATICEDKVIVTEVTEKQIIPSNILPVLVILHIADQVLGQNKIF